MNYPLISEYIEAIKSAEDNFEELTNLRPVLGNDGQPVMTSCKVATDVSEVELTNAWTDEYGVKYSSDQTRLLRAPQDLKEYTIRKGTKVICDDAFNGCKQLSTVHIPLSISNIGSSAFFDCSSLETIAIPEGIENIDAYTFSGCSSLNNIQLPKSVRNLCLNSFSACTNLSSIVLPSHLMYIGCAAFADCASLEKVFLQNDCTKIEEHAFAGCSSKIAFVVPQGFADYYTKMISYDCINWGGDMTIAIPKNALYTKKGKTANEFSQKLVEIGKDCGAEILNEPQVETTDDELPF